MIDTICRVQCAETFNLTPILPIYIDFYIYGLCAVSIEPTLEAQNFIVRPAVVTLLRGLYLWNRKPD